MNQGKFFMTQWLAPIFFVLVGAVGSTNVRAIEQGATLENVIVNPSSDRTYRAISLSNGLRAVLIHDPDTDKAAASLDIQVGSGQDPLHRQGMAHFLEHMLFLGTEPYPEPGEYQAFLSANGGSSNAYTTFDHTNYYFDVDGDQLRGALDRFAPFFSAPLFTPDLVDRERNAVHSEYTAKINDDGRRYFDALKQIVNPEHPFSKFTVGNLTTLDGENLAKEVRQFWNEHYSANLMALAILGPQSLDELEDWTRTLFSEIPNYDYAPLAPIGPMFEDDDLPSVLEVNALRDRRSLSLMFPIPAVDDLYRIKPTSYLGSLIGHEGEGSWFAQLRERGWAEGLSAGLGIAQRDEATFMVTIELTPEGRDNIDEILSLGFSQIHMIETQGIEQWRHAEQGQLLENEFIFLSDGPAQSHVTSMARSLQRYPVQDLIRGRFAWDEYDPELIQRFASLLTPDNMILSYTGPEVSSNTLSPWYQTPFQQRALEERRLIRYRIARSGGASNPDAALPEPNPFIASNFDLIEGGVVDGRPSLIRDEPEVRHWHLSDGEFGKPRADIYLRLRSAAANADPEASVASRMIAALVKDQLNTRTYPALVAGLSFDVYRTLSGITLVAKGYSETVPNLAQLLTQTITQPEIDEGLFELIRQDMIREYNNQRLDAPYERLMQQLPTALIEGYWSNDAQLEAAESLTIEATLRHWQAILDDTSVDLLTHGNLTERQALSAGLKLTDYLPVSGSTPVELPQIRTLPSANRLTIDSDHSDQAWVGFFTQPDSSIEQEALLRVFAQMIKTPFYTELRTQQQLGYIVFAGYMPLLVQPGLVFTVQSPTASPTQIENAAFEFFANFDSEVRSMSVAEIDEFKEAVLTGLNEEDPNLAARSAKFWRSIGLEDTEFDRREKVAAAVQSLTPTDLRNLSRQLAMAKSFAFLSTEAQVEDVSSSAQAR